MEETLIDSICPILRFTSFGLRYLNLYQKSGVKRSSLEEIQGLDKKKNREKYATYYLNYMTLRYKQQLASDLR